VLSEIEISLARAYERCFAPAATKSLGRRKHWRRDPLAGMRRRFFLGRGPSLAGPELEARESELGLITDGKITDGKPEPDCLGFLDKRNIAFPLPQFPRIGVPKLLNPLGCRISVPDALPILSSSPLT
jgi:hypothetical protein